MTLHHHTHQAADGRWHAVYRVPGTAILHSIGDALTERGARSMAQAANAEQERRRPIDEDPLRRPIPAGFYTDEDAA
jgi:hypothetical protein